MKEVIAVIRPYQWQKTKAKLLEEGFHSFTIHRVYGRGKQKGLHYLPKFGKMEEGICFLPKRMVTLFLPDEDAARAAKLIAEINQTGEIGDGKIFISVLEGVERVRTGEKGEETLI